MEENNTNNINQENNENELIYDGNEVSNYEEQACCGNFIFSPFGNNNIFSYINDICFKDIPLNDEEIINNINQEVKTPLCSNKKKLTPNDIIINNENNNNNINPNPNQNIFRNSLKSNPSNYSAAEPIIPLRRNNTVIINKENNGMNGNKNNTNIFSNLANIFKELFGEKNENVDDISDKQSSGSNLSFNKRPILRRLFTNEEKNKNKKNQKDKNNDDSYHIIINLNKEENLPIFEDILTLKTSENNDEDLMNLVSAIPAFIVKEKNKSKNNYNKFCPICLGEFMIGEKESSLPCLHCFHSNCIENWIKRSKFCPVCKLKISWESLNPKF